MAVLLVCVCAAEETKTSRGCWIHGATELRNHGRRIAQDLRIKGSTELVHTLNAGQVSINISKPGITKGQHWHNTKFEQFIVVKGHGLIQQRNLNDPEGKVLEWEVSGDKI